jgi:hypothetical protein
MRQLRECFLLLPALCTASVYATDIHVGSFNAFPNDQRDDTAEIQEAIQACQPGDRLLFRAGTYDLWKGSAPLALSLSDKSQLEIDGRGCTLLLHGFDVVNPDGYASVFVGVDCDQIWIHDLAIDMVREPFSVGQVVAASATSNAVSIQFDPAFPVGSQALMKTVMSYDGLGKPDGSSCDYYFEDGLRGTLVGSQTLEFTMNFVPSLSIGQRVVVRHRVYGANAFFFRASSAISLSDITVYTMPGMALVCASCEDVNATRLAVKIPAGSPRLMSTTADACHFVACHGDLEIVDSHFQGMGDDAVNIHGYFHEISPTDSGTSIVRFETKPNQWHLAYRRGDTVGIYDGTTLGLVGTAIVQQLPTAVSGSSTAYDLQVSAVPPLPANAILSNETLVPTALIQGCLVEDHRGRAFVLQTRGVNVLDNHITGSTGPAIAVRCDIQNWWESTGGQNVALGRNVIDRVNFGAARSHAGIVVETLRGDSSPAPAGAHRDLQIFDQQLSNTPRSAIYVSSAVRTEITGNVMSNISTAAGGLISSDPYRHAIVLVNDQMVLVTGNALSSSLSGVFQSSSSTGVTVRSNSGF